MTSFRGTHHLIRLILRRDRFRLAYWILGITALVGATAGTVVGLYDTAEKRAGYALTADSPATKLLSGRPEGLDNAGAITAYEISVSGLIAISLMVMFLVVRHTRTEEETGRAELLRATVTGRHAAMVAAVTVASVASLLVGALDALVMTVAGLEASGSVLHGATLAATGLVFTAVAAAAAQLTSSARSALGIAGGVLAFLFVLRGIGDLADSFLTWLSPLGWALMAQPYGAARWWLLAPLVVLTLVLVVVTAWLTSHRDAGAGMLRTRPGPDRARPSLGTATGLAWRLQRGSVLGWGTGLVLGGVLFGSVAPEMRTMLESNPAIAELFAVSGGDPVETFLATGFALLAVVAGAFAVSSALRLHAEEGAGRAEWLLATGMSRTRWALGSLTVTLTGVVTVMVLVGLAGATGFALTTGETGSFFRYAGAAMSFTPAVLLLAATAVLLTGWLPRYAAVTFALVLFTFIQVYLGSLLDFPGWLNALSPFDHLPAMPTESFAAAPTLTLLGLTLALGTLGVVGLRRRDIA